VNQHIFPAYSMHPRSERLYDVGPKCVRELWTEEFLARLKRAGASPAEAANCALNNTQRGRSRGPAEVLRREAMEIPLNGKRARKVSTTPNEQPSAKYEMLS